MSSNGGIQLDDDLRHKIEDIARANGMDPSDLIRKAIDQYTPVSWMGSWLERAEAFGLIGCSEEGPSDLSTNKDYFEGFGRD